MYVHPSPGIRVKIDPTVEYVYYSTQSEVSDHAPLYRMNIADRSTNGN